MTSFALLDEAPDIMVDSDGNVYGRPVRELVKGRYRGIYFEGKTHYLHRVIAQTFIPNPEGKPDVAHWDNDGGNNAVSNLRWATEAENMADKIRHGTATLGERHGNAKLTDEQVKEIRVQKAGGTHVDVLASTYGVSRWTIYDACNPKRRQTIG